MNSRNNLRNRISSKIDSVKYYTHPKLGRRGHGYKVLSINPLNGITWASKSITTQSALSPILWLCGICIPFSVAAAIWVPGDFGRILTYILVSPVPTVLVAYFIILATSPNRLHSEKHQQEMRKIEMLGDNRTDGLLIDQTPTSNPNIPAISHER